MPPVCTVNLDFGRSDIDLLRNTARAFAAEKIVPCASELDGTSGASWDRFRIRVISGHKGIAVRKPVVEQHLRVITCCPLRASTTIAQSIVHRGVRKWFRRWSPTSRVFSTR